MKPVVLLLLAGSAVANVVLIGVLATRSSPADAPVSKPASETTSKTGPLAPATTSRIATATWRALHDDDLATFAANLRTAGFTDPAIRAIIGAEIDERFGAREEFLSVFAAQEEMQQWLNRAYARTYVKYMAATGTAVISIRAEH